MLYIAEVLYCVLFWSAGRNVESLKKKLKEVKEEAILHQPVVVVLDDLDELAEQVSDIQKDASGEGMSNTRTAQGEWVCQMCSIV